MAEVPQYQGSIGVSYEDMQTIAELIEKADINTGIPAVDIITNGARIRFSSYGVVLISSESGSDQRAASVLEGARASFGNFLQVQSLYDEEATRRAAFVDLQFQELDRQIKDSDRRSRATS